MAVFSVSSVKLGQEKVPNQILQNGGPYNCTVHSVQDTVHCTAAVLPGFRLSHSSGIYEACESGLEKGLNQTKSSKMAAPYHCTYTACTLQYRVYTV